MRGTVVNKYLRITYKRISLTLFFDTNEEAKKYKSERHNISEILELYEKQWDCTIARMKLYNEFIKVADENGVYPKCYWLESHCALPVYCTLLEKETCTDDLQELFELSKKKHKKRSFIITKRLK